MERKAIDGVVELNANQGSFVSFTFIEGEGQVDDILANLYDTFFLPSGKKCLIKGKGVIIVSRV